MICHLRFFVVFMIQNKNFKLHTGEAEGPNIIPRPWVKELYADKLPAATIVETNTYYEGKPLYNRGTPENTGDKWLDLLPG